MADGRRKDNDRLHVRRLGWSYVFIPLLSFTESIPFNELTAISNVGHKGLHLCDTVRCSPLPPRSLHQGGRVGLLGFPVLSYGQGETEDAPFSQLTPLQPDALSVGLDQSLGQIKP